VQDEDIVSSKLIKLGVPIKDQISKDDSKEYYFVLDRSKPFRIFASVYLGQIKYSIGNKKNFKNPIATSSSNILEITESDLGEFKSGENVYIKVRGEFDHSEFILLATHHSSYSIIPDSFSQEFEIDLDDRKGLQLMYYPSSLEFELKVQINALSPGVKYELYSKRQYLNKLKGDDLVFPVEGEADFGAILWNNDKRNAVKTIKEKSEKDDLFVYLFTLIPRIVDNTVVKYNKAKLSVSMGANTVSILSPNIPVEDNLLPEKSHAKYYKFFANNENREAKIIITP